MKKKGSIYLFYLIGLVIAGLLGVQVYWINNSIRAHKTALDRRLEEDITGVVKEVEESAHCFTLYSKAYIKKGEGVYMVKQSWKDGNFTGPGNGGYIDTMNLYNLFPTREKDSFFFAERSLNFESAPATVDVTMKFSFVGWNTNESKSDTNAYKSGNIANADNFREMLANRFKVDEAIDVQLLDSLVKLKLKENKLDTLYYAGVRKQDEQAYEYLLPNTTTKDLNKATITVPFLSNGFNKPYQLRVYVPDSYASVVRSLLIMMVSSLIIIILLIAAYIYFIRTILSQRRLSDMKNTFINNITHEFRTPITNINLALENWKENAKGLYIDIIEEENRHMERNVEQILQLAMLEADAERKYFSTANVKKIIEDAVKAFDIQIQNAGGIMRTHFNAASPYLFCNEQQLRNMLQNLLDNAIKYSGGNKPIIDISTYDTGSHYVIQVEDNGIGMSAETQKHIFNRFYRGNTGDRHDVKGFGLGMSYVRHIVDVHEGEINIKSKPGKGTRITVYLPKSLETVL